MCICTYKSNMNSNEGKKNTEINISSDNLVSITHCSNCDSCIPSDFSHFYCNNSECVEFSLLCESCCIKIHKPKSKFNHRLLKLYCNQSINSSLSNELNAGYGFCNNCLSTWNFNQKTEFHCNLAQLYCENCQLKYCFMCDKQIHENNNLDHDRIYCDDGNDNESPLDTSKFSSFNQNFNLPSGALNISLYSAQNMTSYAGIIWSGSTLLSQYIYHYFITENKNSTLAETPLESLSFFELGCGCAAIPSLQTWLLGAQLVISTDLNTEALQLLDLNISKLKNATIGSQHSSIQVPVNSILQTKQFAFGDSVDKIFTEVKVSGFDVILGSYILYDSEHFALLAQSILDLMGDKSKCNVLLSSHEPLREHLFFKEFQQQIQQHKTNKQFNVVVQRIRQNPNQIDRWERETLDLDLLIVNHSLNPNISRESTILHLIISKS